ncbi:uncharacterized protein [Argopecten irradians]|uniref:uncharacterized protein n=1 Tax=Argopecten irradians TaxID=31199 RepID=UPI00371D42ED
MATKLKAIRSEIINADEYAFDLEQNIDKVRKFLFKTRPSSPLDVHAQDFTPNPNPLPDSESINVNSNMNDEIHITNNTIRFTEVPPSFNKHISSQYHKLPKLDLPTFSGDILEWQSFWDSFDTAIHSNQTLGDVQKFNYLKSLLRNEALQTVMGFALTNLTFVKAVSLLHERFGQEHKITQRYMPALLDIPTPNNSLVGLRQFYDKVEIYVRGLESLGQSENVYVALLVPIILNKLPGEIRKALAREHKSTNWTLYKLRQGLLHEINIIEAGNPIDQV